MARITIDVNLSPEVEITGYQRYQEGHGLEVRWPLPVRCRCEKCGHDDVAHIEFKTSPQAIRDLNLWEQPCFWIYQAPFHRCARCNYRQHIIPPFKRKDVSYTYRFEQFVLRSLIGSTAEEVARRLGISAETVDRIVENQLTEDRQIDPQRVITDIGLDEFELEEAASALRDVNDRSERPDAAADLGGGAWQRHDGGAEMPGSAHAGTTPTGSHPSGQHGAGLSGGVRPEVAPQPCRDGSVPCG